MNIEDEFNRALVAYIGLGVDIVPSLSRERVERLLGTTRAKDILPDLDMLLLEANSINIDWNQYSLNAAGDYVATSMQHRYPRLSPEALRAIAWKITYDWR